MRLLADPAPAMQQWFSIPFISPNTKNSVSSVTLFASLSPHLSKSHFYQKEQFYKKFFFLARWGLDKIYERLIALLL
jgi:hypothetical protein